MIALLSALVGALAVAAPEARPEPRPVTGDALLPGAVARLGPTPFYCPGFVPVLDIGNPTLWYSPDGKRLAATASNGVYVWEVASGKRLVWVPNDAVTTAAALGLTSDGDIFVSCRLSYDSGDTRAGAFRIDPVSGKVKTRFQPSDSRTFHAVTPDGKLVVSRTRVNTYRDETVANDPDTGKEVWRKPHPEMSWMRLSPDGSRLVTWSSRAGWGAEVLDTATGKTVERFSHTTGPTWQTGGISIGAKAERVALASAWDHGFSVFKSGSEKPLYQENGTAHSRPWYDGAFLTPDGKKVLVLRGRPIRKLETWDATERKLLASVDTELDGVVQISPDGKTFAVAGSRANPSALQFFGTATGKRSALAPARFTQAEVVWWLPDGTLASADEKLTKPVSWNLKTGAMTPLPAGTRPAAEPKVPAGFNPPPGTTALVAAPDGSRVLGVRIDPEELDSAPGDTYLGLFDATGAGVKRFLRPDETKGAAYRFAPDGQTFAVVRGDRTLTLFDAEKGTELGSFRTAGGVGQVAFSPDGRYLATTRDDGPLVVWDVRAAKK